MPRSPRHPNWNVWHAMKQRCTNPNRSDYAYYGGAGISYDPKWETQAGFTDDMGIRPSAAHTLDRRDGSKGYCKDNCRWATRREQVDNSSGPKVITLFGRSQSIAAWCRELGLNRSTVATRMARGRTAQDALTYHKHHK